MNRIKVVLLVSEGLPSRFIFNGLKEEFDIVGVFVDDTVSKRSLIRQRINKLGVFTVMGQVLFMLYAKYLAKKSSLYRKKLIHNLQLNDEDIPSALIVGHCNINNKSTIKLLQNLNPDVVVVNLNRIISSQLINSIEANFLNIHAGITPMYRGVHGGYWALAMGDSDNCGVTVHLIDSGIDTGGVLYQTGIEVDKMDNFITYPLKQIADGISLMKQAIIDSYNKSIDVKKISGESKLWYHPTIFEYFTNKWLRGVK